MPKEAQASVPDMMLQLARLGLYHESGFVFPGYFFILFWV